ncbi:MAG: lysophospholipid acyltransferase family protein [Pirellulaceae bacterium]
MLHDTLSGGMLLAAAAAPVVAAWRGIVRSPYRPGESLLYFGDVLLTRLLWRTTAPARLPLADHQGAVLVCNHRSSVDPFFLQLAARRRVHWMVAREFCEHPAFAWFLNACQVIPVRRTGADTAATKAAIRLVREGGLVGMFPEGRINMTDRFMLPCRPGAAIIAQRAEAPLVPCYIAGSPYDRVPWSPFFMPARVRVSIGAPIDVARPVGPHGEEASAAELIAQCVRKIAELAGREEFTVELAGRQWRPTPAQLEADMRAAADRKRVGRQGR